MPTHRLTRRTEESLEWEPGEREEMTGNCPEAVDIDRAISKATDHLRLTAEGQYNEIVDLEDNQLLENKKEQAPITWTRGESDVRLMQDEDEAISRILFSATCLSSLFLNLPTSALKLCLHEVEFLPDEAAAEYLETQLT